MLALQAPRPARALPTATVFDVGQAASRPSIPARLSTLETVEPGQSVAVRTILAGAGDTVTMLRPGDTLQCRGRTADWLVVEVEGLQEFPVSACDARHVQVEPTAAAAFSDGSAPSRRDAG